MSGADRVATRLTPARIAQDKQRDDCQRGDAVDADEEGKRRVERTETDCHDEVGDLVVQGVQKAASTMLPDLSTA